MSDRAPLLLIVTGPPAAGKTTLAQRLARDLRLPYFGKDTFKEALHDRLGGSSMEESSTLGIAAMELLYLVAEIELSAGRSLLLEANFHPDLSDQYLQAILRRHRALPVQVHCTAAPDVLVARYAARGPRHPVHLDRERIDAVRLQASHGPMALGGPVISVRTDDFSAIDYPGILAAIRSWEI